MRNLIFCLVCLAMAAACLMMTGCGSSPTPGPVVYVKVDRPVTVSCVPKALGPKPAGLATRQALQAIPEGPARYAEMAADWFARVARMEETEPVVEACRSAASP